MIGCPLENLQGLYVAYLRGSDVDFTGYFVEFVLQIFKVQ